MRAGIDPLDLKLRASLRSELFLVTPHKHPITLNPTCVHTTRRNPRACKRLFTNNERRTAMTALNSLIVNEVLRVQDPDARRLGLDRLDEDALILAFARWAEGQLKKWVEYAKGALLFVMVPEGLRDDLFYIRHRARESLFVGDLSEFDRDGGYLLEEFEQMAQ